jgi:hypothetical protein
MRSIMLAAAAALITVGPALAQTGSSGASSSGATTRSQSPSSSLEQKCRTGDQQACQEANRLRGQTQTGSGSATGSPAAPGSTAGSGGASGTQRPAR